MADIDRIKRNLTKMVEQDAPEADLDAYLSSEGFNSVEEWRAASAPKPAAAAPRPVGAAMVQEFPRLEPGPRTSTMPDQPRAWGSVAGEALTNLPSSAANVFKTMATPFVRPVETAQGLYDVGRGLLSKASTPAFARHRDTSPEGLAAKSEREATVNALGDFFANRYGGVENIKNTLSLDPVGVMADASTALMPVRGLPGVARVQSAIDPLTLAGNTLRLGARGAEAGASNVLSMTTGAGTESIRAAGRAGREGGETAAAFRENMRGAPVSEVVDRARAALDQIRTERSAAYKGDMAKLGQDEAVLNFGAIDDAVGKASQVGSFKGVSVEPAAADIVTRMAKQIEDWKALDPAEYHTAVGIDALKRSLGNLRDSTAPRSPERVAADRIYNAVRAEIVAQAPQYAETMEAYSKASEQINEASRAFSLGERATGDTASRKLLSATRNNVQTNYGERGRLLNVLAEQDPTLPYAIAGQGLNALAPRGIVGRGGALVAAGTMSLDPSLLSLGAFSPRIVGETVYLGGRAVGMVDDVANALGITADRLRAIGAGSYQSGRVEDIRSRAMDLRNRNAMAAP